MADLQKIIEDLYQDISNRKDPGQIADYIPELTKVDPQKFGICLTSLDGEQFFAGDYLEPFSIQSIAKVFTLSMAFNILNDKIWKRVGVEPSGNSFNSMIQLEREDGIPRNPLINAGAIVVCDILISELKSPKKDLISALRESTGVSTIDYSKEISNSEKSEGFRNYALVNFMKSFGNIENDVEEVIDFYFNMSSIKMSCEELSKAFLFLANGGINPLTDTRFLGKSKTKRINAIMQTCGFYDEAGEFAFKVGLPGKSGVGGGIMAVLPGQYCITVWSPKLNEKGNSAKGMKFLELFTTKTESSIF